jgi:hypothetical protein
VLSGWDDPPGWGVGGALTIYVDAASDQRVRAEDVSVKVLPSPEDESHDDDIQRFLDASWSTMHEVLGEPYDWSP